MSTFKPLTPDDVPDARVLAFLDKHGKVFYDCLGYSPGSDADMARLLDRVTRGFGRLPGFKDNLDRARCEVLDALLRGEETDLEKIRIAVDLLRVAFNMAVDEIWSLRRLQPPRPPRPPRQPPTPWRRERVRPLR